MSDFLVTPWTVSHQAPLSMGFSRQEYWSGLPVPAPGDLPYPGIDPRSPVAPTWADTLFPTAPPGKTQALLILSRLILVYDVGVDEESVI